MDDLYVIGEKVAGGYPEGRYIASKLKGKVCDYYIIIGVLDYPSIRAVANSDAWSGAKTRKYGDMIISMRDEREIKPPEYDGVLDDSEKSYNESLLSAMDRERRRMIAAGDMEAAFEMARRASFFKKQLKAATDGAPPVGGEITDNREERREKENFRRGENSQ